MDKTVLTRQSDTCGSCKFSQTSGQKDQVFCRRYPPTLSIIPRLVTGADGQQSAAIGARLASWPVVMENGWCGEYAPGVLAANGSKS